MHSIDLFNTTINVERLSSLLRYFIKASVAVMKRIFFRRLPLSSKRMKHLGMAGFLFFFLKGMAWLGAIFLAQDCLR